MIPFIVYKLKGSEGGRFLVTGKILFSKMGIGVVFISESGFFHMENDVVLTDTSSERLWK